MRYSLIHPFKKQRIDKMSGYKYKLLQMAIFLKRGTDVIIIDKKRRFNS